MGLENSEKTENFVKTVVRTSEQYISGEATDFFSRFEEDFSIARHLNHNAIRFGLEWSRIEPEEGRFDQSAQIFMKKCCNQQRPTVYKSFNLASFYIASVAGKKAVFRKRKYYLFFEVFGNGCAAL